MSRIYVAFVFCNHSLAPCSLLNSLEMNYCWVFSQIKANCLSLFVWLRKKLPNKSVKSVTTVLQTCRHACCACAWLDQCTVRRSSHLCWVFPHSQRRQRTSTPVLTWLKKSATTILPILVRWFLLHYTLFFITSLETHKAMLQGIKHS